MFALLQRGNGAILPVYLNAVLRRGASGAGRGGETVHISFISAWRRTEYEAELRRGKRAAEQLASIVSHSSDAIVSVDKGGRILNANFAFSDIFQFDRAEVLGARLSELIVPDQYRGAIRKEIATRGAASDQGRNRPASAQGRNFSRFLAVARSDPGRGDRRDGGHFRHLPRCHGIDPRRRAHRVPAAGGQSPLQEHARGGAGRGAADGALRRQSGSLHRRLHGAPRRHRRQSRHAGLARLARRSGRGTHAHPVLRADRIRGIARSSCPAT